VLRESLYILSFLLLSIIQGTPFPREFAILSLDFLTIFFLSISERQITIQF